MNDNDNNILLIAKSIRDAFIADFLPAHVDDLVRNLLTVLTTIDLESRLAEIHPLGFVHMSLADLACSENLSLHIWSEEFACKTPFAIHNHFFRSLSYIICGEINNDEYSVLVTDKPVREVLYEATYDQTQDTRYLARTLAHVHTRIGKQSVYRQREIYAVDKGTFHKVLVPRTSLTATLFLKTDVDRSMTGSYIVGSVAEVERLVFPTVLVEQYSLKQKIHSILCTMG